MTPWSPGLERQTLGVASLQAPLQVSAAFSNDDRVLATASHDGLRLWDLAKQREVFFVPFSLLTSATFTPGDKGLLVSDQRGLSLWPFERHVETSLVRMQLRATLPVVATTFPAATV